MYYYGTCMELEPIRENWTENNDFFLSIMCETSIANVSGQHFKCAQRNTVNKVIKKHPKPMKSFFLFSLPVFFSFVFCFSTVVIVIIPSSSNEEEYKWKKERKKRTPKSPLRKWRVINVRAIKQIGIWDIFLELFSFSLFVLFVSMEKKEKEEELWGKDTREIELCRV